MLTKVIFQHVDMRLFCNDGVRLAAVILPLKARSGVCGMSVYHEYSACVDNCINMHETSKRFPSYFPNSE